MASNNEIRTLERTCNTLLNRQLQSICVQHGLSKNGVKAELQKRIKDALIETQSSDPQTFNRIRASIQNLNPGHNPLPNSYGGSSSLGYTPTLGKPSSYTQQSSLYGQGTSQMSPSGQLGAPYGSAGGSGGSAKSYYKTGASSARDLQFKPSPFYRIQSRIGDIKTCDAMSQHKNSVPIHFRIGENPTLNCIVTDKSYRVMVFCSADNQTMQDIAFPHQAELKVNSDDVKANLRGLKGKPGTTRPVDITDLLRVKPPSYTNTIEFTYALTNKKFYLALYLCKKVSVEELVIKIKGKKIPKATVISEMAKKANDPDVVATSTVLSLKCPLSYTRLRTPCRSTLCNHVQCFDATSYLQLQEQGPQWICPICNKAATFENLAIDDYVKDILENTSDSLDQVTIEPNGQWHKNASSENPRKRARTSNSASIDVDDDISFLPSGQGSSHGGHSGAHAYSTPSRSFATPSASSREPSGAPRSTNKRAATEVIDLTLSSDEDDEPFALRPPKRQNLGPPNGNPHHYASYS
ncbi:hypothetical protein F5Y18DRAFT_441415 [Xylariaceae sp. FL1019]|nr:hypothetical protein F5Y18DRAFT_441415 [Xylariaceae sp. FL1019]